MNLLRPRYIAFFAFFVSMILLGLFVSRTFLFVGVLSLCFGHMLLHDHGNEQHVHHSASSHDERKD